MLRYTLSYYNAEMFRILKYCCCITCLVTLLSCSPFYNVAEAYFIFLFCWDVPNLETLLMYTLFDYIAEKLPILKYCCCNICLVTLLRCSQSWNIANVFRVLLQSWAKVFGKNRVHNIVNVLWCAIRADFVRHSIVRECKARLCRH